MWVSWITTHRCTSHISMVLTYEVFHLNIFLIIRCVTPRPYLMVCGAAVDSVCTAVRCSCWQCLYGCAVQLLTVSVRLCGAAVDSVCTAARCSCWQCLYSCAVQPLTVCADRISLCSKKGFINRRVKPHCLDQPSSAMYRYNRLTYSKDIQGKRKQKLQLPEPLKLRKV